MKYCFKMRIKSIDGKIEVITGCMFSGKSTELLNRLKKCSAKFLLIKPKIDTRYGLNIVSTHSGKKESAIVVSSLSELSQNLKGIQILGIDEAQFFPVEIIKDCEKLKKMGLRIIIAGLDKDYLNNEFESLSGLMKIADSITKLYAICSRCESPATNSHRLSKEKTKILLGHKNCYEPLCKKCYNDVR